MTAPALSVNDLSVWFENGSSRVPVVDHISFSINPGDATGLVGESGCGKTTLLKLLSGLYHPQSGTLNVDGHPITGSNRQEHRELFTGVFADFCLFPRLYGIDQIDQQRAGTDQAQACTEGNLADVQHEEKPGAGRHQPQLRQ